MDEELTCVQCYRPFYRSRTAGRRPQFCPPCGDWRTTHREAPSQSKAAGRRRHLAKKFGVTPEWVEEELARQDGCAICHTPDSGVRDYHVDHDHATGQVRGVLCHHCNLMLGHSKDSATILEAAAAYLRIRQ